MPAREILSYFQHAGDLDISPPGVQRTSTGARGLVARRDGRVTQDRQLCRGLGEKRTGSVVCHGQIDTHLSKLSSTVWIKMRIPSSRRNPGGWTREMTREVAMETRRATEYSQRPPGALKPGSCNSPPITAYLRAKDIWQKKYIHY